MAPISTHITNSTAAPTPYASTFNRNKVTFLTFSLHPSIYLFIYQAVVSLKCIAKMRHTYTHPYTYTHTLFTPSIQPILGHPLNLTLSHQILLLSSPTLPPPFCSCVETTSTHNTALLDHTTLVTPVLHTCYSTHTPQTPHLHFIESLTHFTNHPL